MSLWRYSKCGASVINAPIARVYAVAADPQMVPRYAPEVRRIEVVHSGDDSVLVKSFFTVAGLTFPVRYRYRYRAPRYYGGIQSRASLLRGYFWFSFVEHGDATRVRHTEGIMSKVPGLAWLAGVLYFYLLSPRGIEQELRALKELVECGVKDASRVAVERRRGAVSS